MNRDTGLERRLRQVPAPAMAPDFPARVFAAVRAAHGRRAWQPAVRYALAASLAMGVALGLWLDTAQDRLAATPSVAVDAGAMTPVRLVFRSPRALTGVTVQLQLPDGVELAGHDGRREWRWQTDLAAGGNVLELPVVVREGDGGLITARVIHGDDQREFSVQVRTRKSASFDALPAQRAAAQVPRFTTLEV